MLNQVAYEERCKRLAALVELRRLYRNLIRAKLLLETPSPLYTPPPTPEEILAQQQQQGGLPLRSGRRWHGWKPPLARCAA